MGRTYEKGRGILKYGRFKGIIGLLYFNNQA
jgi:hypothetical protein